MQAIRFAETSTDLIVLHSRVVVPHAIAKTVVSVHETGKRQYQEFCQLRFIDRTVLVCEPLKRNSLSPFSRTSSAQPKLKAKLSNVKNDCALFSRLYIGCQTRNGNIDEFFSHENQATPPALSEGNSLRFGCKSDLLPCLEGFCSTADQLPNYSAIMLDGAALVNMWRPASGVKQTFQDYSDTVFIPKLMELLKPVSRLDLVWDSYAERSLKSATRAKRGDGIRQRVSANAPLPKNWSEFLRHDANKTELFDFLSDQVSMLSIDNKQIVVTKGTSVLSASLDMNSAELPLNDCNHEEADTRLLLHAAHAAVVGHSSICIRTVDTDVVVLAVTFFFTIHCEQLWIAFGVGKHFRHIAVHEVANALGQNISEALPFFHAVTGCDTVSAFAGRGKKYAWETFNLYPESVNAFQSLSSMPTTLSDTDLAVCERFVVMLYDRTSSECSVNAS